VTVEEPDELVAVLERTPTGVPGEGDELVAVLAAVPDAPPDVTPDVTQVAMPPRRRAPRSAQRTPARASAPAPEEHPTPADMPKHTETEKAPGVTPPADEGLPGPDSDY
jgi:hypothetical protein